MYMNLTLPLVQMWHRVGDNHENLSQLKYQQQQQSYILLLLVAEVFLKENGERIFIVIGRLPDWLGLGGTASPRL